MRHRRGFFQTFTAAAFALPPGLYATAQVKAMVGAGAIGRVLFCRASNSRWLRLAREISAGSQVIAELDQRDNRAETGAVLVGSAATLTVTGRGWRILS
jgi:hypothetical protein